MRVNVRQSRIIWNWRRIQNRPRLNEEFVLKRGALSCGHVLSMKSLNFELQNVKERSSFHGNDESVSSWLLHTSVFFYWLLLSSHVFFQGWNPSNLWLLVHQVPLLFRHEQAGICCFVYCHLLEEREAPYLGGFLCFVFLFLSFWECKKYQNSWRWNPRRFPEITSASDSSGVFGIICSVMKFRSHVLKVPWCALILPSYHLHTSKCYVFQARCASFL